MTVSGVTSPAVRSSYIGILKNATSPLCFLKRRFLNHLLNRLGQISRIPVMA